MAKITLLAEHGCISSGVIGTLDTLAIANSWWQFMGEGDGNPLFETEIVTVDGKPVEGNGGIELKPHKAMNEVDEADLIRVPALFPPFDLKTERIARICEWLRERYKRGNIIAAACTGTLLLAESGLLNGRMATTNWLFTEIFKRQYPKVDLRVGEMITEDGGLVCAGAASAYLNLCLYIIEKYGTPALAAKCSKNLLVDPNRLQANYIVHDFWKHHSDDQILQAQNWMEKHFSENISMSEVAKNVGISPRQFIRRFKTATGETPTSYLQHLRINKAKEYLEMTLDSVNEIVWQVGYEDINSFRRLFIKQTGMTPKMYRDKFSPMRPNGNVR